MKKMKKMAMGGSSIDDDVRKRALASVANLDDSDMPDDSPAGKSSYGEENDMPEVSTPAKKAAPKAAPKAAVKKKYIDIPKNAPIGMRQFKSDEESPIGRLFRKVTGGSKKPSKPSKPADDEPMVAAKKGGLMRSSASKRADGCAVRGKTRA